MRMCIDCNKEEVFERKRCKECVKKYNKERVKKYYNKETKKRYGVTTCVICGESMIKNRPEQITHGKCKVRYKVVENYNKVSRSKKGNTAAKQFLLDSGFIISKNSVVHHLDENPENNSYSNLCVISRKNHNALHGFLREQWFLYMKVYKDNSENCWDILRDQLTTTWFERTDVNVIKITDIGQSAAELLSDNIYLFEL